MSDIAVTVGDVIHFAENQPSVDVKVEAESTPAPTISELLAQSRDAHRRFREADGSIHRDGTIRQAPNYDVAKQMIQIAINARLIAEQADPDHTDLAWDVDRTANRGISNQAMIDFFRDYLL